MALTDIVRVRVDPKTKHAAEKILAKQGISLSTAVRLFLGSVVARKSIAFALTPNAKTIAAIEESRQISAQRNSNDAKTIKQKATAVGKMADATNTGEGTKPASRKKVAPGKS